MGFVTLIDPAINLHQHTSCTCSNNLNHLRINSVSFPVDQNASLAKNALIFHNNSNASTRLRIYDPPIGFINRCHTGMSVEAKRK